VPLVICSSRNRFPSGRRKFSVQKENATTGLQSARENLCRPSGARDLFPLYPALPCRAVTLRRFAAGFPARLFHRSRQDLVLTLFESPPLILEGSTRPIRLRSGQAAELLLFYGNAHADQLSETSIFVAGATPVPAFVLDAIDATIRYPSKTSSTNA